MYKIIKNIDEDKKMNVIIKHADDEIKKLYNNDIFNFEIDKEIRFLYGDYTNTLDVEQKNILRTVETVIINKLFGVVEEYHRILVYFYTVGIMNRTNKQSPYFKELIEHIANLKKTAKFLNSLIL